jgi:NAD(P)-dependent dehydrogenase (short-subunit alcohol dehydrogenase family)
MRNGLVANRIAVIAGAPGNLGRVVSRRLAEEGARLALLSTNPDRLDALERELNLPPERVLARAVDLGQAKAAQNAADAVVEKFGRAEILVHLVGGWTGGQPVVQVAADDVAQMLQQHLWTTFHIAQAFVPHLITNRWGRVIVVSSPQATNPPERGAPYAIGKAAQEALILTLARELSGSGVTANVIHVRAIDAQHQRDPDPSPKTASWTTPEEITATILYLCSDFAAVVNGARLPLYGVP